MKTRKSQIKAVNTYRKGKKQFSLLYERKEKERIELALKMKGFLPREAFHLGLIHIGIEPSTSPNERKIIGFDIPK